MINIQGNLSEALEQVSKFQRHIIYVISLTASLGSLSVSMIFGWDTFTLSVAQRILMYPIVVISGLSMLLDKEKMVKWVLYLSVPGIMVSLYHHLTIRLNTLVGCGFALPCNTGTRIVFQGFTLRPMYLPFLAFTAFTLITLIASISYKEEIREKLIVLRKKLYLWVKGFQRNIKSI